MRPKVVLTLIVCALAVIGVMLVFKPHAGKTAAPAPVATAPEPQPAPEVVSAPPTQMAPPPAPVLPHVMTDEERHDAIEAEVEHLQELSRNDDPQSLSSILLDLTNSEKEVRAAAIEATKQFGSSNAIPALKAAAVNSTDPEEEVAMLEAANFLTLTPMSDASVQQQPLTPQQIQADAQRAAQHEAQRQAQLQAQAQARQNQGQGQNPQPAPPQ